MDEVKKEPEDLDEFCDSIIHLCQQFPEVTRLTYTLNFECRNDNKNRNSELNPKNCLCDDERVNSDFF